jgi:hypothetical protein
MQIHKSTHPQIHTSTHPHIHKSTHPHIHTSTHPQIHKSTNPTDLYDDGLNESGLQPDSGSDRHAAGSAGFTTQRSGPFFPLFVAGFLLLVLVMTSPPLFAQAPPPGPGDLVFIRDDNNYNSIVTIRLELIGVVFNETGSYSTSVDALHPDANAYPFGPYLVGTGPYLNWGVELPMPSNYPEMISWESAALHDTAVPAYSYGSQPEYCPGMIGWGLYRVTLSSAGGYLVFDLNTIDGNWLDPSPNGNQRLVFRVAQSFTGPPNCDIYSWVTNSWDQVSGVGVTTTVSSWSVGTAGRGRDLLHAAWDYNQSTVVPARFAINEVTGYPVDFPGLGIIIDNVTLDVNAEINASNMAISMGKTFEIADWRDEQNQLHTTTMTIAPDVLLHVKGELRLSGTEIVPDVYSVHCIGSTPQRGHWMAIHAEYDGIVHIDGAHIFHAKRGIMLTHGATLDANRVEIADFSEHGIHQDDSRAFVRNARIHDGSIGVWARGACIDSYYGWRDGESVMPVYVYHCEGFGFELVDLEYFIHPVGGGISHQRSFCIQFSEIFRNQLYGVWIRGPGAPLLNMNRIYENGLYGGQIPSHDGVHINGAHVVSVHENHVSKNAYGFHNNDGGHMIGWFYLTEHPHLIDADIQLGFNCLIENTINLGNNRSANTHLGLGDTNNPIHYEWDGTIKKLGGSNSFVNPVSGIQTTNGGGFVFASHNCWLPDYVVSGPVITNGDFADCATHDLPECADLLAPSSPLD